MNSIKCQDTKSTLKFPYINITCEWSIWEEIRKTIPFPIASNRRKYLVLYLTKEMNICTLQSIKYWWQKLKATLINGKRPWVYELE